NYIPACDAQEYAKRTPRVTWTELGEDEPRKVTEYYRLFLRKMISQSGERSLISTLAPPDAAHIHGCISFTLKDHQDLLRAAIICSSLT
ncbi:hypothetical protein, partial [Klebsiella pneumoniae]